MDLKCRVCGEWWPPGKEWPSGAGGGPKDELNLSDSYRNQKSILSLIESAAPKPH